MLYMVPYGIFFCSHNPTHTITHDELQLGYAVLEATI